MTPPVGEDDRRLLAEHVAGSPDAFPTLVRRYQDRLWAVALRTLRDPDDAADALQDALVKAYRAAPGFRGESAVSTWLHRIVVNSCLDLLRRRVPVPVDPTEVPDARVEDPVARLDVAEALAQLPPEQRAAIVLVELQGFSVDDAAAVLGVPNGTVKSRCFRGRARLAELLVDYAPRGSTHASRTSGNQAGVRDVSSEQTRPGRDR
jgi:RNA polymerase sigma-70 factor (ECF subfamily)